MLRRSSRPRVAPFASGDRPSSPDGSSGAKFPRSRFSVRTAAFIGVSSAAAIMALRAAEIANGLVAVVLLGVLIAVLPRPVRVGERVLVVTIVAFGWMPLTGWFPGLLNRVDLAGLVLAVALGLAVSWRARVGWSWFRPAWIDGVAIASGAAAGLWWAAPLVGLGAERRLTVLLGGWDHVAHFSIYARILDAGSFGSLARTAPTDSAWHLWDYPQGMHDALAILQRLLSQVPTTDPSDLINAYWAGLLITIGLTVLLATLAISRLAGRGARLMTVASAMVAAVALFVSLGPGSVGITFGFANFVLAVVALATAASFVIRPSPSLSLDVVVIGGCLLIGSYNWYPMVAVAAPIALPLLHRIFTRVRSVSPGLRVTVWPAVVGYVAVLVLPAFYTFHNGADTLTESGGIPHVPLTWLVAALLGFTLATQWSRRWLPALVSWSLLGVVMMGTASLTVLAAFQLSAGEISYYFEKLGLGVATLAVLVVALLTTDRLAQAADSQQSLTVAALAPSVVALLLLVAPQLPGWTDSFGAYGLAADYREVYSEEAHPLNDVASDLVAAATEIRGRTIEARFESLLIDTDGEGPSPILNDFWLAALTDTWTRSRALQADRFIALTEPPADVVRLADLVVSLLAQPSSHDLVAEEGLLAELARRDPAWLEGSIVLGSHG